MSSPEAAAVPSVSVCIPTYNAAATLAETLASILAQTHRDIEIVVSDNASTDATVAIASGFADRRIRIERLPSNVGAERNFARCIELARGRYTAIFHADDVYEPDLIRQQADYLDRHPASVAVFSEAALIDAAGAVIGERRTPTKLVRTERDGGFDFIPVLKAILRHHNFLMTPSAMVRTADYRQIRAFDSTRFGSSADLDVWLQLLQRGQIGILRERLLRYRVFEAQGSARLIRGRSDRADFLTVLDAYVARPEVAAHLGAEDRQNHRWLEQSDRVARALASYERDPGSDLRGLLGSLFHRGDLGAALLRRPRILVCYVIAALLRGAAVAGSGPALGRSVRALRRLAKV